MKRALGLILLVVTVTTIKVASGSSFVQKILNYGEVAENSATVAYSLKSGILSNNKAAVLESAGKLALLTEEANAQTTGGTVVKRVSKLREDYQQVLDELNAVKAAKSSGITKEELNATVDSKITESKNVWEKGLAAIKESLKSPTPLVATGVATQAELAALSASLNSSITNLSKSTQTTLSAAMQAGNTPTPATTSGTLLIDGSNAMTGNLSGTSASFSGAGSFGGALTVSGTATTTFANGGFTVGVSQFVIQGATGNVGIGTTTPTWLLNPSSATAAQLALSAGAGVGQWAFRNAGGNLYFATTTVAGNATTSTSALSIIGSNGNVGINTTSPGSKLAVSGGVTIGSGYTGVAASDGDFVVGGNTSLGDTAQLGRLTVAGQSAEQTSISTIVANTAYNLSLANFNEQEGNFRTLAFMSNNATTSALIASQLISTTTNLWSGDLEFFTQNAGQTSERMRITNGGNVGIGTTTPYARLSVVGEAVAANFSATSTTATSTFNGGIVFGSNSVLQDLAATPGGVLFPITGGYLVNDPSDFYWDFINLRLGIGTSTPTSILQINGGTRPQFVLTDPNGGIDLKHMYASSSAGSLTFGELNDALSTFTERMRIDASGNVGIGTITPTQRLSVAGNINVDRFSAFMQDDQDIIYATTTGVGSGFFAGRGTASWMKATSTVMNNVAIGINNMVTAPTTGEAILNIAVGIDALASNTQGHRNTAIGNGVLYSNTTGAFNVAIGETTLYYNTTGSINTGVGNSALQRNTTGFSNTGIGRFALYSNTTGLRNTALGDGAGYGDETADMRSVIDNDATFIGFNASRDPAVASTTGMNNITAIGKNARVGCGNCLVLGGTGADEVNVGIGTTTPSWKLQVTSASTPQLVLSDSDSGTNLKHWAVSSLGGNLYFATSSDLFATSTKNALTIDTNGLIGISTSTPWRTLSVSGTVALSALTSSGTGNAICISSSKEILDAGGGTCTPSASRFKENIETLSITALDVVKQFRPVTFDLKSDGSRHLGFIAEEVRAIEPRLTFDGNDGLIRGVRYEEMTALLTKAIQEQQAQIDSIRSGIGSSNLSIDSKGELVAKTLMVSSTVEFGSASNPIGVTLYDTVTKEAKCLTIANSATLVSAGKCGVTNETPPSTTIEETTVSDTVAPVLTLNGNSPANLTVGDTYSDMGVTVSDNTDSNLGYETSGDTVDTTKAGTYIVIYTAEDNSHNVSTTTRTVIVSEPETSAPPAE
ncbi:MAG: DUF5011 domain-containing protein [Candidatus Vogelbacteria bacterium]|nr:DUF5011 domain-containing protein [Candidatus Vogelbacteria bacterium]